MSLLLTILLCSPFYVSSESPPLLPLDVRHEALRHELQVVEQDADRYYLIIDLTTGRLDLRAGAKILARWPITVGPTSFDAGVHLLTLEQHLEPMTFEPGPARGRLGGRFLPLDFVGRLTEGARAATRLYFTPPFLLQGDFLSKPDVAGVTLNGQHIKSLASALIPGSPAILIAAGTDSTS